MFVVKRILFGILALGLIAHARAEDWLHAGPLFDDFDLTLAPGHRIEALGPFFYSEEKETQRTWAIPPLFSSLHDPVADYVEYDFVYPLLTYDRFGSEYRWQIFQVINFSGGQNQEEQKARRTTLFYCNGLAWRNKSLLIFWITGLASSRRKMRLMIR